MKYYISKAEDDNRFRVRSTLRFYRFGNIVYETDDYKEALAKCKQANYDAKRERKLRQTKPVITKEKPPGLF